MTKISGLFASFNLKFGHVSGATDVFELRDVCKEGLAVVDEGSANYYVEGSLSSVGLVCQLVESLTSHLRDLLLL